MSSIKNEVKLQINYEDNTSRTVTFEHVKQSAATNIAQRVASLNANPSAEFRTTFRSDNNARATGIGKAQFIQTEEEVIYGD